MIDTTFIDRLLELARVEIKDFDGRKYVSKKLAPVVDPVADPVVMHTLTGLVDLLPSLKSEGMMVHVADFNQVHIISPLFGPFKQREVFATAKAYDLLFIFDKYLPLEDFLIRMQTMFVQDESTEKIIRLASNLTHGAEQTFEDDGVTQRVTAKVGVARVAQVEVPNPVELRPFRTFADVEQPISKFVFRIQAGNNGKAPSCALFEADGGAWKNAAIANIRQWLAGHVQIKIIA